jgi:ABC-type lipoprotein export system ATPase subunit
MAASDPLLALADIERDYRSLRPLRIKSLELHPSETVAILGLDLAAAEVLVNIATGATLPDRGTVSIFGRDTRDITDADTWMRALDDFGIVSERVALLEAMTVEQNLTLPLSLELDAIEAAVRTQVRAIADEVGLEPGLLAAPAASLDAAARLRLRLAKALITRPRVLLAEHPNASLPPDEVPGFAADLSGIISRRSLAALILTADRTFAGAIAQRVLTLHPATGELNASRGWRLWFGG